MSRVGKQPIAIPSGVEVTVGEGQVSVKGPKGQLSERIPAEIGDLRRGRSGQVRSAPDDRKPTRALHGLARALVANMVRGVTEEFVRELEIQGVGYRAEAPGKKLVLSVGHSHPVEMAVPQGVQVSVENNVIVKDQRREIGSRWVNSQPTFGRFDRPSPTRARASVTGTSTCGARSARPERRLGAEHGVEGSQREGAQDASRAAVACRQEERASAEPRLTMFRSAKHIYAQIIDVPKGRTVASVSTRSKELRDSGYGGNVDAAKRVGQKVAEVARGKEIQKVVFNRNGFLYHGRVKALAEAAREAGLEF